MTCFRTKHFAFVKKKIDTESRTTTSRSLLNVHLKTVPSVKDQENFN